MILAASFFAEAIAVEALFFSNILAIINPTATATTAVIIIVTILSMIVVVNCYLLEF